MRNDVGSRVTQGNRKVAGSSYLGSICCSGEGEHGVRPYKTWFLVGANPVFALEARIDSSPFVDQFRLYDPPLPYGFKMAVATRQTISGNCSKVYLLLARSSH
jgi:hypothetical protein